MPSADELRYLKGRYKSLKSDAEGILSELDSCKLLISSANDKFVKTIIAVDESFDGGKFNTMKSSVDDMVYKLRNTVIPALNSKISEIDEKIAAAEAEEAASAE